jgi:hypothetical protein
VTDRNGVEHHRWISAGGCQIVGRVFVAHRDRVLDAWRANESEKVSASEVSLLRGPYVKPLPFRLERVG